jgi:hypothetical protein
MAGSNAIGRGALILSANADGMLAGLNRAEQKVGQFADKVKAKEKQVDGFGKNFAKGLAVGFGGAAFGSVAVQQLSKLGDLAQEWYTNQRKVALELRNTKEAIDTNIRAMDRALAKRDKKITDEVDPAKRRKLVDEEIKSTEELLAQGEKYRAYLDARSMSLAETLNWENAELRASGDLEAARQRNALAVETLTERIGTLRKRLEELKETEEKLKNPETNQGTVDRFVKDLQLQRETLGMTSIDAQIHRMQAEMTLSDQQIGQMRAAAQELEVAQKQLAESKLKIPFAGAMLRGSAEASSLITREQNPMKNGDAKKQGADIAAIRATVQKLAAQMLMSRPGTGGLAVKVVE